MIKSKEDLISAMKNGAVVKGERGWSGMVYYNLLTAAGPESPDVPSRFIEPLIRSGEVEVFEMWAWRWAWR